MGKRFNFWSMCIRRAWQRSSPFANDWQWAFGVPFWQWASGTSTFAGFAKYLVFSGHGSMSTGYPALDGIIVAAAAFAVTWIVGFVLNIFSGSSHFYYEEKERADTLQQQLGELKNRYRYRLAVTAEVEQLKKKPECLIRIENTSDEPLEYGPAVLSAAFQNEPNVVNCQDHVLRPHRWGYYSFKFDEMATTKGQGCVSFTADIDYGSPGNRTRRLHKEIGIEYTVGDYGFIMRQVATVRDDHEIAI